MTKWKTCVCLALLAGPAIAGETRGKPGVPVYTNEDLDRVRPFRDETGVASVPAFAPERPSGSAPGPDVAGVKARGRSALRHSEEYWRAEAERVRGQLRKLEAKADDLRRRIGAARPEPWSSTRRQRPAPDTSAWQARLAAVERLRLDVETDFLDRARREGALPGWLR